MELDGYGFRRYTLDDWKQINALYFSEYGQDYPYPLHACRHDLALLSTVAVCPSEGIIGFARATPYEGHRDIYEFGGLIVATPHRHKKIARHLTDDRMAAVLKRDPRYIISEPVCYRTDCASQFNLIKRGFRFTGLRPFKYPSLTKHILGEQPESVSVAIRSLQGKPDFESRPVYLPKDYEPYLESVGLAPATKTYELKEGMPDVSIDRSVKANSVAGSDFVHIPLNWKESLATIKNYRRRGYLFSGFMPGFGKTQSEQTYDLLTLYKPPQGSYDFTKIHVHAIMDKLKALMAHEYAVVGHKKSESIYPDKQVRIE